MLLQIGDEHRDTSDSLQGRCSMFRYIIMLSKIDVAVRVEEGVKSARSLSLRRSIESLN